MQRVCAHVSLAPGCLSSSLEWSCDRCSCQGWEARGKKWGDGGGGGLGAAYGLVGGSQPIKSNAFLILFTPLFHGLAFCCFLGSLYIIAFNCVVRLSCLRKALWGINVPRRVPIWLHVCPESQPPKKQQCNFFPFLECWSPGRFFPRFHLFLILNTSLNDFVHDSGFSYSLCVGDFAKHTSKCLLNMQY